MKTITLAEFENILCDKGVCLYNTKTGTLHHAHVERYKQEPAEIQLYEGVFLDRFEPDLGDICLAPEYIKVRNGCVGLPVPVAKTRAGEVRYVPVTTYFRVIRVQSVVVRHTGETL